jgi:hypothetical protein
MNKFVTPKGRAVYPSIIRPDTRYNEEGVYKTGLELSPKDAEKLVEDLKACYVEEFGAKKLPSAKLPFKKNDDGTLVFNFKSKNAPKIFDAKGNPIKDPSELRVGGGSVVKIAGAMKAYNAGGATGVTCYLNSVQIISLVEWGGSGPFSAEEGDFEAAAEEKFGEKEKAAETEDVDF